MSDLEKITVNLGPVDLGKVDLLVLEGFYANRADFIRTAIRNQIAAHADAVSRSVTREELVVGLQRYARVDLEAVRQAGERLRVRALGLVVIADDVPPGLATDVFESIVVLGAWRAPRAVKAALADRIQTP